MDHSSISQPSTKSMLFYRDLTAYTGGHQKVADYFQHIKSSESYSPYISFSARSRWDDTNPWYPAYQFNTVSYSPAEYNYMFLAGMDWDVYLKSIDSFSRPIINLIQHVRHADPKEDVHAFLGYPAIRICVSPEVEQAIVATGKVNGPVFTVANGLDLPVVTNIEKKFDVIILGVKQPDLAQQIYAQCISSGMRCCLIDKHINRELLYEKMAQSKISILLPHMTEGFYLPALESMHFCNLTIVPDCMGNRSFCKHRENCLMPEYDLSSLLFALQQAKEYMADQLTYDLLSANAKATVNRHSLARERKDFLAIMDQVNDLWPSALSASNMRNKN